MTESENNPVIFVGAGPGDPDLITVAGRRALEQADLVVYAGSLVSTRQLEWCRPDADRVDSAGLNLGEIVDRMAEARAAGRKVVRLHTGDPSLYGAVREQFLALESRGIPYRVVPGVTAAFSAAAALGLEYTLPEICQSLIITRIAGRTPVPEAEDLADLAAHRTSLAVYLSAGRAAAVADDLMKAYGADASLAVVYRASWPDEKILWTSVTRLADDLAAAGIDRQALILAGPAVEALRAGLDSPRSKLYDPAFSHGCRNGDG